MLILFKRLNMVKGIFYIFSQLTGSLLAASLLKLLSPETNLGKKNLKDNMIGYPQNTVNPVYTGIYECIGTFLVVFVYYLVVFSVKKTNVFIYGISLGSVYFVNLLIYGHITGGSANIARIFGPAFISKKFTNIISSSIGSMLGAFLGTALCEFFLLFDRSVSEFTSNKDPEAMAHQQNMEEELSAQDESHEGGSVEGDDASEEIEPRETTKPLEL